MRDSMGIFQGSAESLPAVRLKDLFDCCRLLDKNNFVKVIVYFPFGFLLLTLRLIICIVGLLILSLLPKTPTWSYILKRLCKVLGLVINIDDKYIDDNAKLLVANHVSILDRFAVNLMKPCNTITKDFQMKDMNILSFWKDVDIQYCRELTDNDLRSFHACVEGSSIPVLHFAEGATTNGKVGLLKFHPSAFSFSFIIQPVLVQVSVSSFISASPSVLGSNVYADILWPFFVPQIYYNLKVLPSMVKLPEESAKDFSKRVQHTMASAMGLIPTVYTSSDKFELEKQMRTSATMSDNSSSSSKRNVSDPEQYSEILKRSKVLALTEKTTLNTAAKSFGKSPKERMLSYKERKMMLIEAARLKYLQKHNIL